MTIYGTIEYRMGDEGSKSEGFRASLIADEGKRYRLYRAGMLPYDDPFFEPLDGLTVKAEGEYEEETGYFRVDSVTLEDETEAEAEVEAETGADTEDENKTETDDTELN